MRIVKKGTISMKGEKGEEKGNENATQAGGSLKNKEYDKELARLHVELVKLQ